MDDPSEYWNDGSYTSVGMYPTAIGQILNYSGTIHSGIVRSTSSSIWQVLLDSKWGDYGLYRHTYGHDPYGVGALVLNSYKLS